MPCRRSVLTAALGAALLVPAPLRAASEDALLIDLRDGSGKLLRRFRLDHAALAALPQTEYVTRTIWTSGPQRFRGVALATLLGHLGIDAAEIELEGTAGGNELNPDWSVCHGFEQHQDAWQGAL